MTYSKNLKCIMSKFVKLVHFAKDFPKSVSWTVLHCCGINILAGMAYKDVATFNLTTGERYIGCITEELQLYCKYWFVTVTYSAGD